MVAPLILLDPKLAFGALLKLFALRELQKLLVLLTHGTVHLRLLAGHFIVPFDSAVQTILFFALQALETFGVAFLEKEHVGTVGSRTP